MDTSKEYIVMCQDAFKFIPDVNLKSLDNNTFWAQIYNGEYLINERTVMVGDVPLFRQDQLQEMLEGHGLRNLAYEFAIFVRTDKSPYEPSPGRQFDSFEQLWLCFIMFDKFNKTWNGKEWK